MNKWNLIIFIFVILSCSSTKNRIKTNETKNTSKSAHSPTSGIQKEKKCTCDSLFDNSLNIKINRLNSDSFLQNNKDIYVIEAYDENNKIIEINMFGAIGIDTVYSCSLPIEEIIRIEKDLCCDIITSYPNDHIYFKYNKDYCRQYVMLSYEGFEYLIIIHTLDLGSNNCPASYINEENIMANDSLFRNRFIYNITNNIINSYYLGD